MNADLNARIDEAITYLRVLKKWINDENQDYQTKTNAKNWLYKLLTAVEYIAREIEKK